LQEPLYSLIRVGDSNVPNTGKVYYKMFKLVENLGACAKDGDTYEDAELLYGVAADQWEFMFHPFHGAGAQICYMFCGSLRQPVTLTCRGMRSPLAVYVLNRHAVAAARQGTRSTRSFAMKTMTSCLTRRS
jgi:hypothetical protein